MTSLAIEIHQRSKRFHAEIARRAALVPQRLEYSFSIPNTPFGIPKRRPTPIQPIRPEPFWRRMWFYDLVFMPPNSSTRIVTIHEVKLATIRHFGLTMAEFISDRRDHKVVRPRQIGMALAKSMTARSLPEIGRHFGGRDHTTVLHGIRKIERLALTDEKIAADIEAIRKQVLA